ncbi:MAG: primosomal replication protein [Pseudomonadota bacterium]|jgi:primosomal replication protein N
MNRVVLTAQIVERQALRYTPAGLPALDLRIAHDSLVQEAGASRKVSFEMRAVGIGAVAERLNRIAVGDTARIAGFLGPIARGKSVLLHITELQSIDPQAPAPASTAREP